MHQIQVPCLCKLTEYVEELAFLIKDNLPCKHLVLSIEEALVNFLQDDNSLDGVMELEPMNPYERLLVHRLADIFGFAHVSIGEGDERHLTLERCPETRQCIPSILVSDIIWQYQESQPPTMSHQLLRRNEASQRICAAEARNVPVVARRMIAHALGHRINSCNQDVKECEGQIAELTVQDKDSSAEACQNENSRCKTSVGSHNGNGAVSHGGRKTPQKSADRSPSNSSSPQAEEIDRVFAQRTQRRYIWELQGGCLLMPWDCNHQRMLLFQNPETHSR
ncbi:hypothetical protein AAG906_013564 [Vitis piasezkii]